MTKKKTKLADLKTFDMAEHLDSEQAIAEYLTIVLEENDPAALAGALGTATASVKLGCGARHSSQQLVDQRPSRCAIRRWHRGC